MRQDGGALERQAKGRSHACCEGFGSLSQGLWKATQNLSKGNYSEFPISIELLLAISGTGNLVTLPPPQPSCLLHLDKHFSWGASSQA